MENSKKVATNFKNIKSINKQRVKLKNKISSDKYTKDDIQKLNALDIDLENIKDERLSKITELKNFIKEYGVEICELFSKSEIRESNKELMEIGNKSTRSFIKIKRSEKSQPKDLTEIDSRIKNSDDEESNKTASKHKINVGRIF